MGGKSSDFFPINRGVAQVCTLSPTLLLIYINGLLCEIKKCQQVSVKFSENRMSCLSLADDFVRLAETRPALLRLIDVVYDYSKCWCFEANVKKSAVIILGGKWVRGQ